MSNEPIPSERLVVPGAAELLEQQQQRVYRRTDRLFAWLLWVEWLAGIVAALVVSPRTWAGSESHVHPHVWFAVVIGGLICLPAAVVAAYRPGRLSTRLVVSTAQALCSAMLIHLTGGRIETHFHVFGSLAFLSFYRDWRALVPATVVTALDHYFRGQFFPESVYGVLAASPWRWLEHAGWVVFEDVFLVASCVRSTAEMRLTAERNAESERRAAELTAMRDTALDAIVGMDHEGRITSFNPAAEKKFGHPAVYAVGRPLDELLIPAEARSGHNEGLKRYLAGGVGAVLNKRVEVEALHADGSRIPVEMAVTVV
jgi:PAS domain S-box-containing protein